MNLIAKIDYSDTFVSGTQVNGEIFIALVDAVTGLPTNGNNVTISYQQNINGVVYDGHATIAGQNAVIYTGLVSDSDPAHYFFTTFQVTRIGPVPDPAPPVNTCNLQINYITVNQPESSPGAANAQITVNATSSYGPIQYSLDQDNFQSSPTFSGLTGGLQQVYVTDPNGCTDTSTVTIPVISNMLMKDPSVSLAGNCVSRWNAAFNPVVFSYQRKDFEVSGIELDTVTGNAAITVNCDTAQIKNTLAAIAQANSNALALNIVLTNNNPVYLYLNAGPYKGTFQVMQVSEAGKLVLNTPFNTSATGYCNINLLRPYYQVRTQITYVDPNSGLQNTITSTNRPDHTGLVKADISTFLQSLLRAKDDSDFTQVNYRDTNLSASYQIAYAEYWDGKLSSDQALTFIPISKPFYVLYAAKQLGEPYGGNLAAYVPFRTVTDNSRLARWITDFAEPAYSNGYPFDISFIYSDDLMGLQLYCAVTTLDINRNPVSGGLQNHYLLNDDGSWLLNQDGSKLIIAGQAISNRPIPAQLGLNRLLINDHFSGDVYYFTLALKYDDEAGNTHTVTQTQTVRVDDAIDEQSVYLRWIGVSGSWNYYRFVYNQEISLDVQNATIIKNYVSDWENQDGIEEVIGKSAGQKMKVMAEDLAVADIRGLQSIKYSPKVQMLVNKNPVKWQTIILNTATFSEYETANGRAPFSVTFNRPSINIQTQ